ncbi:MAG: hypothetical protein ACOVOV_20090, partial [Dolichospermum sp.]
VFTISGTPTQNGSFGYQVQTSGSGLCGSTAQTGGTLNINPGPNISLNGTGATTFNNQDYFVICASTPSLFTFLNNTTSSGTITNYKIVWGDASPDFNSSTFSSPLTHTYPVGIDSLNFTVTVGTCIQTKTYRIFVGNVPAGGLVGNGGATICSDQSQVFNLANIDNNPPGTTYTLDTKDGTVITYNHPAPSSITKFFTTSSCGTSSSNGNTTFNNAFGAYLTIVNPCGSLGSSIVPIFVSQKPVANFTRSDTVVCVGKTISFNFNGVKGNNVVNQVCKGGKLVWKITPGTINNSYTITTGSLGNDFGLSDVDLWTTGTNNINVRFDSSGSYSMKLNAGSGALCGVKDTALLICVNSTPTSSFSLTKSTICLGDTATAISTASIPLCGKTTYQWTISYAAINGCTPSTSNVVYTIGSDTSANPQFRFNNPGTYTISLVTGIKGITCTSTSSSQTITVKGKPNISINSIASVCQGENITPTAATPTCYISSATYNWAFAGGIPATANTLVPGNVQMNIAGSSTV